MAKPKPLELSVKFALRLDPDVYKDLFEYSKKNSISINRAINILCRHTLYDERKEREKLEGKAN